MDDRVDGGRRMPALDGLRAVAVALVMAYHGGVAGPATAGFLGVDVFFVLSGFLITTLLLTEEERTGRLRLTSFWGRRARRLLPGLLVMLVATDLWVAIGAPAGRYPGFRGDALSVLAYASNWHFVAASSDYFAAAGAPSLLTHTWSLAIEEQFYLVWPPAVWALARLARRRRTRPETLVGAVGAAGAVASAAWMAALYREGVSPSRLYYGTDTHAQSILVGVALAAVVRLAGRRLAGCLRPGAALAALVGLLGAACTFGSADPVTYQGGFLAVAGLSAVVIAGLVARPGVTGRLLGAAVPAYLGRISYGMYLWYFPLFALIDHARTGLTGGALFAARCAADVAVAALSFRFVEQPLRRWRPGHQARPWGRLAPLGAGLAGLAGVAGLVAVDTPPAFSASPPPPGAAAIPAGGAPGGLRVLIAGDSTGATLGMDLAFPSVARRYGLVVDDAAVYGCGLVVSAAVLEYGQVTSPAAPCNRASPRAQLWPAVLAREVSAFHPDVVLVVAGRWEVSTRRPAAGDRWTDITQPGDAADVERRLEEVAAIAARGGARIAVATAPCFSSGEQPDGSPWPEDSDARRARYNAIVRAFVAAHPASTLIDLGALVCPGGRFRTTIAGVTVRAPDGVHYPYFTFGPAASRPEPDTAAQAEAFGLWAAARITPLLKEPPA